MRVQYLGFAWQLPSTRMKLDMGFVHTLINVEIQAKLIHSLSCMCFQEPSKIFIANSFFLPGFHTFSTLAILCRAARLGGTFFFTA